MAGDTMSFELIDVPPIKGTSYFCGEYLCAMKWLGPVNETDIYYFWQDNTSPDHFVFCRVLNGKRSDDLSVGIVIDPEMLITSNVQQILLEVRTHRARIKAAAEIEEAITS